MKWQTILKLLLLAVVAIGLIGTVTLEAKLKEDQQVSVNQPVKVEVVEKEGGYQLLRGGKPYIVKGAGIDSLHLESLAAHGGNSLRTWSVDDGNETAQQLLDRARKSVV